MARVAAAVTLATRTERDRRPWLWAGFGALLSFCLFFLIRPFLDPGDAYGPRLIPGITFSYSFLVVAAFIPYAVAAWASRSGISLRMAAVTGGLLHLVVLMAPLTQSQDLYAYLFYGKMWAVHGANPYTVLPMRFASDPWFGWMQWRDQVSVYGPLWTLITGGVARLAGDSLALGYVLMKAALLVLGVVSTLGIARVAEDRGRHPGREVLLLLWNPLVIVSLPLGGHADVAVIAAVVWAVAADRRGHSMLATLALTAAWLVKAYAAVVLVVYLLALLRRRLRSAVAAAGVAVGVTVLAWLPFWQGLDTLKGLGEVAGRASASLGGQVQLLLTELLGEDSASLTVRIMGAAIVAGVIVWFARRRGFSDDPWPAAAAAFLAYVLVTPWFLYWHLVGPLALAAIAGTQAVRNAAFTLSGTLMLTASFGGSPWGRVVQTTLRYAPPGIVGLTAARRSPTEGTPPRSLRPRRSSA
jgi:hypothetical protein